MQLSSERWWENNSPPSERIQEEVHQLHLEIIGEPGPNPLSKRLFDFALALFGLAQVAGDYYLTPRQKLRFDRLYINHASLGFDLKLLCLAFLIAFWFRWQKGWDGRLPRGLLRFGSHKRAA